ncbi:MAG: tRNA (N6-isopentenyl adenosine(37)-C2)-methylthiotransferase MiaB [Saprospiraceae bacterium]|nr:tRNA (N6-isopentenyl adenosine(37)-C2)-methylthiotransferase MiaB [Bacteroidia bacterium]MBT8228935.1 tRNA (N6-isopentenyl adenosine(37)-C2)-methylthiotransferase MiaB [Bacteroidia bacterium]NNF21451.1 tRNA (N6-isopentenyl adenosine(37)-C2)-methylthiotransferase MiaB [Saprospiraceae bacterium]NNK89299.1 tRNA (N6-isopentenyl adenosine(37)-C2)-methylthiotransferase MiaB [Saprospiraceae bacterium]
MYNDNPTLDNVAKTIDPTKQGEVFSNISGNITGSKKFYIESYGCAMNFSDSEIVASILSDQGYGPTKEMSEADLILVNTCSIREKAEDNVRQRLRIFEGIKKNKPGVLIGVLGCMAERLKSKFLDEEKLVDIVLGPDAYRDLPNLIKGAEDGERGVNVLLSREETYADIAPVRLGSNGICGFISIMRGCDNMCSFCVVPFTRGRERSRDPFSIVSEAHNLFENGFRDVTLLGQNVDSYKWENPETGNIVTFADLLVMVAGVHSDLRVRFSTSHPKDITDEVLYAIRDHENVCNYVHLPVQAGNSRILKLMNRTYDRAWYDSKVKRIYEVIPDCAISSDIITGFCSETEKEHLETLDVIQKSEFSMSYMFIYSERPGTMAARKYKDDIPKKVKKRRLSEVIRLQNQISFEHNKRDIGKVFKVLIEGDSKRSDKEFKGRNSQYKMVIFPKRDGLEKGDYTYVKVESITSGSLKGKIVDP